MPLTALLAKKQIAEGTMAFYFRKPPDFHYVAGQFVDMTIPNPPETDAEGNTRAFSLASASHEKDLMIATRMRDTAFKRVLAKMEPGTEVEISEPMGSFVLHKNPAKGAVFLMGGIGITPAFSIVKCAAEHKLPHQLVMFYSNKRPEDAPFLDELTAVSQQNPNFKLVTTMTEMQNSAKPWTGETGLITDELVKKHVDPSKDAIWYLSGPPGMVKAMRKLLLSMNVDEDNFRTEEFSGY